MTLGSRSRRGAVLIGAALLVVLAGTASASRSLPPRTDEVNGITVEVSQTRVNRRGAVMTITMDTHEGALDVDLRKRSTLTVDGTRWPVASYRGDGPGGHHREGTLRFRSAGPATGLMRLTIAGLGGTAEVAWRLASR